MATSAPPQADGEDAPALTLGTLIEELERIPEPAVVVLSGGTIVAANRATTRLAGIRVAGMTIAQALERYGARRADGSRVIRADLPCARALRGEIVDQGERLELGLPDGSVYPTVVTSSPVIVEGKVVAALSVLHDFDAYIRGLASSSPPDGDGPAEGR